MAQSGFDRRRINGPEESFPPIFKPERDQEARRWKLGEPRERRTPADIRAICAKFTLMDILFRAAYWDFILSSLAARIDKSGEWIRIRRN